MTALGKQSEAVSPAPIQDASSPVSRPSTAAEDVKAQIAEALQRRKFANTKSSNTSAAPSIAGRLSPRPAPAAGPTPVAYVAPVRSKEAGPEAAIRASQRATHYDSVDAAPPSWAKVTLQQNLIGAGIFAVILLALWFFYGAGVHRDLRLSGTYKFDRTVEVQKGACTRYFFLLSACEANLIDKSNATAAMQSTSYMVMFRNMGGTPLVPVRSTVERDAVSVRVATSDTLTNRAASLYGLSTLCLLALIIFSRRLLTGRYADGPAMAADQ